MNIDLLPLAACALESTNGTKRGHAEAHTLTLRLTHPAGPSSHDAPMSGCASVEPLPAPSESALRAAVLPVEAAGLTLTF